MIKVIPVVDQDGLNVKAMVLSIDVDDGADVYKAVQAACEEYCKTEEGRKKHTEEIATVSTEVILKHMRQTAFAVIMASERLILHV